MKFDAAMTKSGVDEALDKELNSQTLKFVALNTFHTFTADS